MLLEYAFLISAAAHHPDTAAAGLCYPISGPGSAMDRRRFQRERRFHDEMQPSIRPDQQREVVRLLAIVRSGNIEYPLRVLEKNVH